MTNFGEILRLGRTAAVSMPRWALPFYWISAACLLVFVGFIWLIAGFCMAMRPLYEGPRRG